MPTVLPARAVPGLPVVAAPRLTNHLSDNPSPDAPAEVTTGPTLGVTPRGNRDPTLGDAEDPSRPGLALTLPSSSARCLAGEAQHMAMKVRTIKPDELHWFASVGDYGEDWLVGTVSGFWKGEGAHSSPDWCFVSEDDGDLVARVLFYSLPSAPDERVMFGLHLPWEADFREAGAAFLPEVLKRMHAGGAGRIDYAIYSMYAKHPEAQCEAVEAAGFRLVQQKKHLVWKDPGHAVEVPGRLRFRTLKAVGETEFTDAVRCVTAGSLDRDLAGDIERLGPEPAARALVKLLKDTDCNEDWWQLGFTPEGELVGLVVPSALDDDEGSIGHIGVVPGLRGNRYGDDLLAQGTAVLQSAGFKQVIAETDSENSPMLAALARAGYEADSTLWEYRYEPATGG